MTLEKKKSGKSKLGRPRLNPDHILSDRERRRRLTGAKPREITFVLFDPQLVPYEIVGLIHRCALVGKVVGCSRQQVEADRPGLKAIPIGSLTVREKKWLD